jgi:hypothetical protein
MLKANVSARHSRDVGVTRYETLKVFNLGATICNAQLAGK